MINPGSTWAKGHYQRGIGGVEDLPPETKVCERCGREYHRGEGQSRQSNKYWRVRRYCTEECRRAALRLDLTSPTKVCRGCGEEKDRIAGFHKQKGAPDGRRSLCKPCGRARRKRATPEANRRANLRAFYGITPEEYDSMLEAQDGVCAICRQPETASRNGKVYALTVDHCHDTKKIRGLLCGNCNKGIGGLRHDPALLEAAMRYLKDTA